jgi:hypothetical protein
VWLHGSVLTVCEDGAPDMIVLPVNDMSPAVIAEGIRRHLCQVGRSHPQAA